MIQAIDPQAIRMQTASPSSSGSGSRAMGDFAALMSNAAPVAAETVAVNTGNYNSASITHAAVTGMSGGAQAYSYPGALGTGTTYGGGVYSGAGAGYTGGASGAGGYAGANSAGVDPLMMTQAIRDMNMEMINLQSGVQQEARYFMTASNVQKAEFDMNKNSIQNIRV